LNQTTGLYSRYAISLLYDKQAKRIAGLQPKSFVTIATPHLGVRRFLAVPVPDRLHFAAPLFLGATGRCLFLRPDNGEGGGEDAPPLLLRMTQDEAFMAPLAAFKHRRAYGNTKEDMLVPMGTALFTPLSVIGEHWKFKEQIVVPDPETAHATLEVYHLPPVTVDTDATFGAPMGGDAGASSDWMEHEMARRLDSLGWEKYAVSFKFPMLNAHNMICALSRNPIIARLFRQGRGVMDHAAELIVDG